MHVFAPENVQVYNKTVITMYKTDRVVKMFCCNRSNEESNRSGWVSGQGQSPGRRPRVAILTDQRAISTDDFQQQSVNFDNSAYTYT